MLRGTRGPKAGPSKRKGKVSLEICWKSGTDIRNRNWIMAHPGLWKDLQLVPGTWEACMWPKDMRWKSV